MVFLHNQLPSRKRPPSSSSFLSPLRPSKIPQSTTAIDNTKTPSSPSRAQNDAVEAIDKTVSILAEAGCTLLNPSGPPCLPSDHVKLRSHLHRLFSISDNAPALRSAFLAGFTSYINSSPDNLQRVLVSSNKYGRNESLMRQLLLVPSIQLDLQLLLLEKLPEHFNFDSECSLENDVARLIVTQFRWLDFIVHSNAFNDKLMQVLSICPPHLKKEIIGSLPEIIGDSSSKTVVDSLGQLLQDDSSIIVSVLDCFSNLNLDDVLQEQVVTIAISYIRTIDGEYMPHLLRFLLLSATPQNVRRIISQIRHQLKFIGLSSNSHATQNQKLKGKSLVENTDAYVLDALRTSLLFKNMLRQEILKELISLEKPQDHKIIDLWLLVLIYMNGDSMQKSIEKIFKKKVVDDCITKVMIDRCIYGNKDLVQDYFPLFLSLSEYLLACREHKAREFGIHIFTCLFKEFDSTYYRHEVLGALVTHVGSGVSFEVNSALEALSLLVAKHDQELIPYSTHINGILDYLEGFSIENIHKVYEVFSQLAMIARSSKECFGSSFVNELLIIVKKQVNHPDMKYKKMGLIGTLKIVSCLQKTSCEEALELLRTSLESCKHLHLPLALFYDELTEMLQHKQLEPAIMEWIARHAGEFESLYLSDLDSGQLCGADLHGGLEGELWMNLDGSISPICLSILPLASSFLQSMSTLQILPAHFLLLSSVERLSNEGSLGGIDALLGCPLHLPSFKYLSESGRKTLTTKQKEIVCLSLYYATNWIRELLNAFCTQVAQGIECISQATKEDIIAKLMKRMRNLIFLESSLNNFIQFYPMCLPELCLHVQRSGTLSLDHANSPVHVENKNEQRKVNDNTSQDNKFRKILKSSSSDMNGNLHQPTLFDVLRRGGAKTSQQALHEDSSDKSLKPTISSEESSFDSAAPLVLEVPAATKALDGQRFKFRPLLIQCFSLLEFSKKRDSCCSDPAAELSLYLYLLRDLHNKLDYFTLGRKIMSKCMGPTFGFSGMPLEKFLSKVTPLLPHLRRHFECAVSFLKEDGIETCEEHWNVHSASAGNPDTANILFSKSSVSISVSKEVLCCFRKMLNLPESQMEKKVLTDLLEAFQPCKIPETVLSSIQPSSLPGTLEYLYLGASSFFEDVLNTALSFSFTLASECILTLESIVISVHNFLDKMEGTGKSTSSISIQKILPTLHRRLGTSAHKLLSHNWDDENLENGWKSKGEIMQKMLRIYLENNDSQSDLLDELAGSVLTQASSSRTVTEEDYHGFGTLCNETFVVWYRVLHEVNLATLNNRVKDAIINKPRADIQFEIVEKHLIEIRRTVNVVVSLINMCRTNNKVTVHAMAVKYGGKFVDSFLKVFDFLQSHFQTHNELVIELVKELQKATRTMQTLCSEAKVSKQITITSKIPSTKRAVERFLFHVKALLHTAPNAPTFWMGNLKHKDLTGQVIGSQVYVDDDQSDESLADNDQPSSIPNVL
ncbi:uncharacterized protein LOC126674021 isoform X2 [Mercurialis annua]|uniref:uncharacterized protein LOC126674021 isoform X2 n=1 Tax=Mercurialis annua TaxID=3986 RepID=UPI00216079EE|nr:uncharacterized protein LOC126674021 isoform X2 [Mercurialis annua]